MTTERNEETVRRQKLEELRADRFNYPNRFKPNALASELHAELGGVDKSELESIDRKVSVAGRIMTRRIMGKATFATIQDRTGPLQCYLRKDELDEALYDQFIHLWDIGDIVGVTGKVFKTNRGELSVHAESIELQAKSLHALPDKFHGLADQELRYRQRYVDLIANDESKNVFVIRAKLIRALRDFFEKRQFIEVETPMMHAIPGGALAKPFVTHHRSLDLDLYLRVAPELHLKRLVVGGLERVYEINRNFRNEGLSTKHNPEFTMLEFYQAYATFEDLIELTREMLIEIVTECVGSSVIEYQGHKVDFSQPMRRLTMQEAVAAHFDVDSVVLDEEKAVKALAEKQDIQCEHGETWGYLLNELFEACVEDTLVEPTFITHHPVDISPLARLNESDPRTTDRFELFVMGREIANGFSELNDPDDQKQRFLDQVARLESGDSEAMHFDQDYITALEYGMPPTAGEGVGIDRLAMLLTDSPTIRDVLLFPLLRPRH